MTPYDDQKQTPENAGDGEDTALRVDATSEDGLDLDSEELEGKVAEIAKDNSSENKGDNAGKASQTQTAAKKDEAMVDDRVALRERLLKTAPQESVMRAEIKKELEGKKILLESEIRGYERRREYHLLSAAVAQLRAVVKQLEVVAKAGYDALREIWLKVVHKFA